MKGKDLAGRETLRNAAPDAPFCAQVFKTTIDHFAGRIDYVRVFSGTLKPEAVVMNPRTRTEERVAHFYRTDGAQTAEVQEAGPGEFVVLLKLKDAHTGDTLCDRDAPVVLPEFAQHTRPVSYAVHAKTGDDKAAAALHKLIEEDPSLELARSPDTGEMLLQGMGQAHIEVTVERVKRKHGVEITLAPPSPAYLETITASSKAQGKFKRQTGGHGQYGDAHVELHPKAARRGVRVRGRHRRRRHPAAVHPVGREGHPRRARRRAARRLPGRGLQGEAGVRHATTTWTAPTWRSRSRARWPSRRRCTRRGPSCSSRS